MGNHDFSKRRVWVTGASSGIGQAIALNLAARGSKVIISARNQDALKETAKEMGDQCALILPFDVKSRSENMKAAQAIEKEIGGIDIVILNAGVLVPYQIEHFRSEPFEECIITNYLGMIYGIEAALPLLRQSSYPHLVGMSSLASYRGLPLGHGAYSGSKAAIRNMLEALRFDLLPEGIPVSVITPGFVKTKLSDQNTFKMPFRLSTAEAAERIVKGIERYKQEIHFPRRMSIPSKILATFPLPLYTWIMARIFGIKGKNLPPCL